MEFEPTILMRSALLVSRLTNVAKADPPRSLVPDPTNGILCVYNAFDAYGITCAGPQACTIRKRLPKTQTDFVDAIRRT